MIKEGRLQKELMKGLEEIASERGLLLTSIKSRRAQVVGWTGVSFLSLFFLLCVFSGIKPVLKKHFKIMRSS